MDNKNFGEWAVLELMGHVKMAGYVTEEEHFGAKLGRIDVPGPDGQTAVTQYFGGQSVYRLTPVSEDIARAFAVGNQPAPVTRYELRQIEGTHTPVRMADDAYDDEYEGDLQTEDEDW